MTYGVVSKGNGDSFIQPEYHTSLSIGGGQAGQGYPCVLIVDDMWDRPLQPNADRRCVEADDGLGY